MTSALTISYFGREVVDSRSSGIMPGGLRQESWIQGRSTAREVRLEQGVVTFVLASKNVVVPATEIEEFRRSRGDLSHFMPIRVRTAHDGVVKVAPRLCGLFQFLIELRRFNPMVEIGEPF